LGIKAKKQVSVGFGGEFTGISFFFPIVAGEKM
jgi:hypothetical protein